MNIFDNIAKNVRKAQVPAVESLTESEIDGLTFAATTNEDYDTLGAAMEAMGVKTAYKEEKVDKDDLTESEIRQLYNAGMEDEDPDDYEDPYTEETIIDGYIDEAYADEADEALGELTEEDLEDIEDDEGTESYLSAVDFEDIAEEGYKPHRLSKMMKASIQEKKDDEYRKSMDEYRYRKIDDISKSSDEEVEKKYDELVRNIKMITISAKRLVSKYKDILQVDEWEERLDTGNQYTELMYVINDSIRFHLSQCAKENESAENNNEEKPHNLAQIRKDMNEIRKFALRFENEHQLLDRLKYKCKSRKAVESFTSIISTPATVALESKLQRDRVKNAKQRKAFIDQQLKTLNTAIKVKQREIKAYRKEHKKDANYADRLEKLTTDMNDIIAKQTQYSKELAGLNEIINMKGYTESEQARINQMKDTKAQLKLDHKEQAYQAKMARREEDYKRQQDRLDKQNEMAFKQKMAQDARSFMMQDHTADRNLRRLELGQDEDHKMDMYRAERQYNAEMDKMRAELEESRRNSANLAAETNKTIAELQALVEEQKQAAAVQQQNMMQAMQTNMQNSLQTKNPFLKKFNQKTMDNFSNMMKTMQTNMQAMNVAVASFCYGVNEEDIAEESALDLISAFAPVSDKEHP